MDTLTKQCRHWVREALIPKLIEHEDRVKKVKRNFTGPKRVWHNGRWYERQENETFYEFGLRVGGQEWIKKINS